MLKKINSIIQIMHAVNILYTGNYNIHELNKPLDKTTNILCTPIMLTLCLQTVHIATQCSGTPVFLQE